MAAIGRESRLMPTVKCSTCGAQVQIALMGEHVCTTSASPAAEASPPLPAASLFGRLMPTFSNPLTQKQQPRAPPQVDTSAANRAYMGQTQLTPVSLSSGSQSAVSPQTPSALRPGLGKADEYFGPKIANNSPPPPQSPRPGGYGGLDGSSGDDDSALPANAPKKQAPNLMERLNSIPAGPFGTGRRPSAAGPERPGTSAGSPSSKLGSGTGPNGPRQNGDGGLGPSPRPLGGADEQPLSPNRSDTFPRPSDRFAPPARSPSAPPSADNMRPDRLRSPLDAPGDRDGRAPMTSENTRRPSGGPGTSGPPPPRTGVGRPKTPVVPTINLAEEFGVGNPYHTPSGSTSSDNSENSSRQERRPSQASQASQASSRTSPPRSLSSRSGRKPSDTTSFDNLMSDLQSSMDEMKPKPRPVPPLKLPPRGPFANDRPSPLSARPPRSGERGYDPRIDPAVQNPRYARGRAVPPSPSVNRPPQEGLTVQTPSDVLSPSTAGLSSPRWTSSPERIPDAQQRSPPQEQRQPRERSRSQPRDATSQPTRGNCKACGLPIKGKSISSADGRLTGRYHKPCFVCHTCQEPFSSATFYVLDDKPYCELHYHKLNGSLCGSCGRGIEGQYLEDESAVKHHVGCFKCGECGMALRDGYFEVNGKAYCEKDAWRLVQQPWMAGGGGGSSLRPPHPGLPGGPRGAPGGGYHPSRLGPPGPRPRMEKRMTRLGMM